jgi:hypothetical protein
MRLFVSRSEISGSTVPLETDRGILAGMALRLFQEILFRRIARGVRSGFRFPLGWTDPASRLRMAGDGKAVSRGFQRAVGRPASLTSPAIRTVRRWFQGQRAARIAFQWPRRKKQRREASGSDRLRSDAARWHRPERRWRSHSPLRTRHTRERSHAMVRRAGVESPSLVCVAETNERLGAADRWHRFPRVQNLGVCIFVFCG